MVRATPLSWQAVRAAIASSRGVVLGPLECQRQQPCTQQGLTSSQRVLCWASCFACCAGGQVDACCWMQTLLITLYLLSVLVSPWVSVPKGPCRHFGRAKLWLRIPCGRSPMHIPHCCAGRVQGRAGGGAAARGEGGRHARRVRGQPRDHPGRAHALPGTQDALRRPAAAVVVREAPAAAHASRPYAELALMTLADELASMDVQHAQLLRRAY